MTPLFSNILKKDVEWCWTKTEHAAYTTVSESLLHALIVAFPDPDRPFSVVYDTSDFAIGSALLQTDVDGQKRVITLSPDS